MDEDRHMKNWDLVLNRFWLANEKNKWDLAAAI